MVGLVDLIYSTRRVKSRRGVIFCRSPTNNASLLPLWLIPPLSMAKSLHKVLKKVAKKRGAHSSSLNENSRDAQKLRRASARSEKLDRRGPARTKANQDYRMKPPNRGGISLECCAMLIADSPADCFPARGNRYHY